MEKRDMRNNEQQLDALFSAYRDAIPDPDCSAGFMPGVWERIDRRRNFGVRFAKGFLSFAAAMSLLLLAVLLSPTTQNATVYTVTYIDVLDDERAPDQLAFLEVHSEPGVDVTVQ
jgi:hypothetical protein